MIDGGEIGVAAMSWRCTDLLCDCCMTSRNTLTRERRLRRIGESKCTVKYRNSNKRLTV
jgi:hypothetical protein